MSPAVPGHILEIDTRGVSSLHRTSSSWTSRSSIRYHRFGGSCLVPFRTDRWSVDSPPTRDSEMETLHHRPRCFSTRCEMFQVPHDWDRGRISAWRGHRFHTFEDFANVCQVRCAVGPYSLSIRSTSLCIVPFYCVSHDRCN